MDNYEMVVPKNAIGPTLLEVMAHNEKVVVMSSDVSVSANVEMIHDKYADRFFEMGIAEQSTMSVSGGMATEGLIPVYAALSIFSAGMTFPQMRQVCNANLNVKIIGTHAGVDDGPDGSGHHATEDIAITRAIPRMTVIAPSDIYEVEAGIHEMVRFDGPIYMRIARAEQPVIHEKGCEFPIGKAEVIYNEGDDFALVYEGTALKQALEGWALLQQKGYHGKLVSIRTIKPIDKECILNLAQNVGVILTVENHSVIGGLYSAIAEFLMQKKHKAVVRPIGFQDVFMESGKESDIKEKYGLSGMAILKVYEDYKKIW